MKTFSVSARAEAEGGEYVLGSKDTGTHACYMIYGTLEPGQKGRMVRPGAGHEELLLATRGHLVLSGHVEGTLEEGKAIHLVGEETCYLENPSSNKRALYVIAGGHSEGGH